MAVPVYSYAIVVGLLVGVLFSESVPDRVRDWLDGHFYQACAVVVLSILLGALMVAVWLPK